jgi:hypothetical protein
MIFLRYFFFLWVRKMENFHGQKKYAPRLQTIIFGSRVIRIRVNFFNFFFMLLKLTFFLFSIWVWKFQKPRIPCCCQIFGSAFFPHFFWNYFGAMFSCIFRGMLTIIFRREFNSKILYSSYIFLNAVMQIFLWNKFSIFCKLFVVRHTGLFQSFTDCKFILRRRIFFRL